MLLFLLIIITEQYISFFNLLQNLAKCLLTYKILYENNKTLVNYYLLRKKNCRFLKIMNINYELHLCDVIIVVIIFATVYS